MVKVKICGLTRPCDIDAVNAEMPDYIGFVFAESRRKVMPRQARELRARLAAGIVPVGVFVDEAVETVVSLVREGVVDIVQLHGAEDERTIEILKSLTDAPIIKAVSVRSADDVKKWASSAADYLLLDNANGGSGETFDWSLISNGVRLAAARKASCERLQDDESNNYELGKGHVQSAIVNPACGGEMHTVTFFLAGGLNVTNITQAIETVKPFAVDVSSGVETDGFKDPAKIREFIRRAKNV